MAKFKKGQTPWNKGKHPEYVQGKNHPMYGKKHSESTKEKISRGVQNSLESGHTVWNSGKALGLYGTPFYNSWREMKQRCLNPKTANYEDYGGRGIGICKKWLTFKYFYKDMYSTYKKGLTLDRIDNDGDYRKKNCRWATRKQQAENRRNTHLFEYMGVADTLTNWANFLKMKRSTLAQRIYVYKWNIEKSLTTPIGGGGSYR